MEKGGPLNCVSQVAAERLLGLGHTRDKTMLSTDFFLKWSLKASRDQDVGPRVRYTGDRAALSVARFLQRAQGRLGIVVCRASSIFLGWPLKASHLYPILKIGLFGFLMSSSLSYL